MKHIQGGQVSHEECGVGGGPGGDLEQHVLGLITLSIWVSMHHSSLPMLRRLGVHLFIQSNELREITFTKAQPGGSKSHKVAWVGLSHLLLLKISYVHITFFPIKNNTVLYKCVYIILS